MMQQITAETVALCGRRLCLNFANTTDWSDDEEPLAPEEDALVDVDSLLRWGRRVELYGGGELGALREAVAADPGRGASELAAAKELRGAVHRAFAAIARGGPPAEADLEQVRRTYRDAVAAGRLAAAGREADPPDAERASGAAASWRLAWPASELGRVRFPVAVSAVTLLDDAEALARVKMCPGHACGSLFHDASGRRRWCSMATCGSRAKMRRHYARRKALRH